MREYGISRSFPRRGEVDGRPERERWGSGRDFLITGGCGKRERGISSGWDSGIVYIRGEISQGGVSPERLGLHAPISIGSSSDGDDFSSTDGSTGVEPGTTTCVSRRFKYSFFRCLEFFRGPTENR